jgi:hypothetical protein
MTLILLIVSLLLNFILHKELKSKSNRDYITGYDDGYCAAIKDNHILGE